MLRWLFQEEHGRRSTVRFDVVRMCREERDDPLSETGLTPRILQDRFQCREFCSTGRCDLDNIGYFRYKSLASREFRYTLALLPMGTDPAGTRIVFPWSAFFARLDLTATTAFTIHFVTSRV